MVAGTIMLVDEMLVYAMDKLRGPIELHEQVLYTVIACPGGINGKS